MTDTLNVCKDDVCIEYILASGEGKNTFFLIMFANSIVAGF